MNEEITEEDFGIFANQESVVDNIKKASEEAGVPTEGLDRLKDGKPLEFLIAKKSCKNCWGQGTVSFVQNEPKKIRNTSISEDRLERQERMIKALCGCVKVQME